MKGSDPLSPNLQVERPKAATQIRGYDQLIDGIQKLLAEARRRTARSVNAILTATYWEVGRKIIEFEQKGKKRASYGETLLQRLSMDLTRRLGRGFSVDNLELMRRFYLAWPPSRISETLSRKSSGCLRQLKSETAPRKFSSVDLAKALPLSWSHYVNLLGVDNAHAPSFYAAEALRWLQCLPREAVFNLRK